MREMTVTEVRSGVSLGVTLQDLQSAFDHAPTGIVVLTPAGVVTGGNPALALILGRELTELVGNTLFPYTHPEDLPAARANCAAIAAGSVTEVREDCRFLRTDGTAVWVRVSTCRVAGRADRAAHLIMHVEDISEHKALEARLLHQALHDPLTEVGNRALLLQQVTADLTHPYPQPATLGDECRDGELSVRVCGMVVLDVDGFKALNDAHGHPTGDAALIEVAHRVQAQLAPDDLVVRLGGDEFAVWCPVTTPDQLADLVTRLHEALDDPCQLGGAVMQVSASIGSATTTFAPGPPPGDRDNDAVIQVLAELLRAADTAMFAVKHRLAAPPH